MKNLTFSILILVFISLRAAAQNTSVDSTLTMIEALYNNGQYLSAEVEARRMLEQNGLNDSAKVRTEQWVAFSLIAQGKSSAAKDRFVAILKIDGTFELDPILTSPKILSVFNDARVKYLSLKKSMNNDSLQSAAHNQNEESTVSFRTIVFPGWEQLYQKRSTAGYLFLGAGAAALGSALTFEYLRSDARNKYLNASTPSVIASKYDTYNTYRKGEIYSFAIFAMIYLASEVDVFSKERITVQPKYSMKTGGAVQFSLRF